MKIENIQNDSIKYKFTGKMINNYALRKFKAGLNSKDADIFEKYINEIDKIKDNKKYVFQPSIAGNFKIAKIYTADAEGNSINPPILFCNGDNTLSLFKKLANIYKSRT